MLIGIGEIIFNGRVFIDFSARMVKAGIRKNVGVIQDLIGAEKADVPEVGAVGIEVDVVGAFGIQAKRFSDVFVKERLCGFAGLGVDGIKPVKSNGRDRLVVNDGVVTEIQAFDVPVDKLSPEGP